MRKILTTILLSSVACGAAQAATAPAPILWGVSDSGMDFGSGGLVNKNYAVPDPAYYLAHGFNVIRIPFQIGRLQPTPNAPLDPAVVGYLQKIIAADTAAGAVTVLDPHGYGYYNIDGKPQEISQNPEAAADYVDMMGRIAQTFGKENVAIGLMNEPHSGSDVDYAKIWNSAIAVIRKAGFKGVILVPHGHWSAAQDISPSHPYNGVITDPDNNWVLELHSYLDPDATGTYKQPIANVNVGVNRLAGAIAWSQVSHVRLFLGETGVPSDTASLAAFQAELDQITATKGVFWGVAIWGAGPWWKPNYPMRLDPVAGVDRPQMALLENMVAPQVFYLAHDIGADAPMVTISIDGKPIGPAISVTAPRTGAPQMVPVMEKLRPGTHEVKVAAQGPGSTAYVVGSTWKGTSDSPNSFGTATAAGYVFKINVPAAP